MKTEQEVVKIIGLRVENNNVVKAIMLTPDIFKNQLIQLVGDSGNGKSTIIDSLKAAINGPESIKKKDALESGFLTEAQLVDGDIKIFVGARCREIERGERKGEPIFETFLYSKDENGKPYTPIIDNEPATAAKYAKLLTTELTFSMPDFFSENQTVHRKLIERLFAPEMEALGADETVAAINKLREDRDSARSICQRTGSYMESFEKEGYSDEYLSGLQHIDLSKIDFDITEKVIERDRILHPSNSEYELAIERINNERASKLRELQDRIREAQEAVRQDRSSKESAYSEAISKYADQESRRAQWTKAKEDLIMALQTFFHNDDSIGKITPVINERWDKIQQKLNLQRPIQEPYCGDLETELHKAKLELETFEATEVVYPEKPIPDTTTIDAEIEALRVSRTTAELNNALADRYANWTNWIEAKGKYEVKVDELRRMYAKIDTGVDGLSIVPNVVNDKVEVWIMYNGQYDTEFFHNEGKEMRYIFNYSSFQRSAIGVMLQAARLNLKRKALRLAIVDDVAFTEKGLSVLSNLCKELDVQLITARTDDYDKAHIKEGEVIIENGECFFNLIASENV